MKRRRVVGALSGSALLLLLSALTVDTPLLAQTQSSATPRQMPGEVPGLMVPSSQFANDPMHSGRFMREGPHERPVIRWRVRARHRVHASPIIGRDGLIRFVGLDGMLHLINRDGIEQAAWAAPGDVFATPAVLFDDLTVVGFDGGGVTAVGPRGDVRWTARSTDNVDASPTVASDGSIYVASRAVMSFSFNGALRWSTNLNAHAFASPALSRDQSTLVVGDLGGELTWIRTNDGHVLRRVRVGAPIFGGALMLADDTAVVGARDGHVRAYAADGTLRWDFTTRDEVHGTPALAGNYDVIVIGSDDGGIYRLRAVDGTLLQRVPTSGRVRASAVIDNAGWAFVGSGDDAIHAIDETGVERWALTLGADIDASIAIGEQRMLYVGCDDAALYALAPP